jgi:hypothetical protein
MRIFLAIVIGFAAVVRLAWFAEFAFLSVRRCHPPGHGVWKRLKDDALLPPKLHGSREQQEERYDLFKTHQVAAYTLGGLALATWSILASRPSVDRFALAMLVGTVLTSIGSAMLFRAAGGELTRMGYESGLSIAGLTLGVLKHWLDLRERAFTDEARRYGLPAPKGIALLGIPDQRAQRADVIVRRQHVGRASNDIGFARQQDGSYQVLISRFESARFNARWLERLDARYAYHATLAVLTRQHFEVIHETTRDDGEVHLVLRRIS